MVVHKIYVGLTKFTKHILYIYMFETLFTLSYVEGKYKFIQIWHWWSKYNEWVCIQGQPSCVCIPKSSISSRGASTVKWTIHDPCLVLSESDSKLYIYVEFFEEIYYRPLETYLSIKPINLWWQKISRKSTYFRRRCKWCASRWYSTNNCLKIFKIQ